MQFIDPGRWENSYTWSSIDNWNSPVQVPAASLSGAHEHPAWEMRRSGHVRRSVRQHPAEKTWPCRFLLHPHSPAVMQPNRQTHAYTLFVVCMRVCSSGIILDGSSRYTRARMQARNDRGITWVACPSSRFGQCACVPVENLALPPEKNNLQVIHLCWNQEVGSYFQISVEEAVYVS